MRNKAIGEGRNDAVREHVRGLIETRYGGNSGECAKTLGVAPSLLSELLSGKRGAGMKLLTALAAETGLTIDQLTRAAEDVDAPTSDRSVGPAAGDAVGYREAEKVIRAEEPGMAPWAWAKARRIRGLTLPAPVTPELVLRLARLAEQMTSLDERARLETEGIERSNEAARKSHATKERNRALAAAEGANDAPPTAPRTGRKKAPKP